MRSLYVVVAVLLMGLSSAARAGELSIISPPPELPPGLTLEDIKVVTARRLPIVATYSALKAKLRAHNARCSRVPEKTPLEASCQADKLTIEGEIAQYLDDREKLKRFINTAFRPEELDGAVVADALVEIARKDRHFAPKEITRLKIALSALRLTENGETADVVRAWRDVLARTSDGEIKTLITKADGPLVEWAGGQTNFEDCTLFAMANAAHVPYGGVAQLANALIRKATYRPAVARLQPQKMIKAYGLYGHELAYIAESLGQVEVIGPSRFAETIRSGAPVMIAVRPPDGSGAHQVVLNKTFARKGETWYGMLDSSNGQLALSASELHMIAIENGIVFRPDTGGTPLLR